MLAALVAGMPVATGAAIALAWTLGLLGLFAADFGVTRRAWHRAAPRLQRRLPTALAIAVECEVHLAIETEGTGQWQCALFDYVHPTLQTRGLPVALVLRGGARTTASYFMTPTRRGLITLQAAAVRVRSRFGLCELVERLGGDESRRVFPDFSQVARYAWLAGDRRLGELGIKSLPRRGEGTDFEQLAEYRPGDSVRHIDWKATRRFGKPVVREFQDERDQCVMLLLDAGRRMRAEEGPVGGGFFDHVLNAVMLLAYVALRHGDEVGVMTFGTPAAEARAVAPRKGAAALDFLMGKLYDLQPTLAHSDYTAAASALMSRHGKRALVVVVTNFRDEDSSELAHALELLRTRHLVLLASLRERAVSALADQPLGADEAPVEVASAHLYEQSRRDAFRRLAARDALMVDAPPERLGIELVNRYHAAKLAGLI